MEVSPSVVGEVQLLEAQDQEGDQQLSILQLEPLQKLFGKYPHIKELAEYSTVSMSSRSMMPIKPTHLPVTPLDCLVQPHSSGRPSVLSYICVCPLWHAVRTQSHVA